MNCMWGLMYALQRLHRIGPISPKSTIGGSISPGSVLAMGEMTKARGTATCFMTSDVVGTLYIVDRMKRGPELPWSWVTYLVVTKGGTSPG